MRVPHFVFLFALFAAFPAAAQQLHINHDDCSAAGNPKNKNLDCASTAAQDVIICSVSVPADVSNVIADLGVIDLLVDSPPDVLPDFWQFYNGGCSGIANRVFDADFRAGPFSCYDFWRGEAGGGGIYRSSDSPATNRPRIKHTWTLFPDQARALPGGIETYISRLVIEHTTALTCPGCPTPVCAAYVQETFSRLNDTDYVVDSPDFLTFNGSGPCSPVPSRRTTWGSVKALYR